MMRIHRTCILIGLLAAIVAGGEPSQDGTAVDWRIRVDALYSGASEEDLAEFVEMLESLDEESRTKKLDRIAQLNQSQRTSLLRAINIRSGKGAFVAENFSDWLKGVDHADAVFFNHSVAEDKSLVEAGVLHPGTKDGKVVRLTAKQLAQAQALLVGKNPGYMRARCFLPHHGIVFYDRSGKILGHIEVCLLCSTTRSNPPKGLSDYWGLRGLQKLFIECGFPVFSSIEEATAHFANPKAEQGADDQLPARAESNAE